MTAEGFIGRYRLVERIAVGGMGEVFLARYVTPAGVERLAVIKRILPHLSKNPAFVRYFLNEGRITSLLCHPNIVQTIELGRSGEHYFIAMEHIPGITLVRLLANTMRAGAHLSIPLIHQIATQVTSALEYLHGLTTLGGTPLNIIHMDLAPHNILITPDGQAKLLDFGISISTGLNHEADRSNFRGRTAYLAPEQLDALPLDQRVDLFALGIIMHEMVLVRPLFRARVDQQTATRILYAPIPTLRSVRPDCPELLENLILKSLIRDRDLRYQKASAVVADLDHCAQVHHIFATKAQLRDELARLAQVPSSPATDSSFPFEASASISNK